MKLLPGTSCCPIKFDAGLSCGTMTGLLAHPRPGGRQLTVVFEAMMIFQAMIRTSQAATPVHRISAGLALQLGMVLILVSSSGASAAQKLVDPNSVAPEYRAVAEKRRAEQIKLLECSKKADQAKVPRRDRAAHISECLDK
jgi:hypothetical protein